MTMQINKEKPVNVSVLNVLVTIIVARFSCIVLSNIPFLTMGYLFVYSVFFIISFAFVSQKLTKTEAYALLSLMVYVFEVMISCLIAGKGLFETQAFNSYILVILYFVYLYIKRLDGKKQRNFSILLLCGFSFTFIYSIIKLAQDPMLSRIAATGRFNEDTVDVLGAIGGFDTAYGGLLVFIVLIYLLPVVKGDFIKIFLAITLISCVAFIIMATYATAIVLLIIALGIMIFKRNKLSATLLFLTVLICFALREVIGEEIMNWSKTIEYSDVMKDKMYQIGYMIRYGESVGTLAGEEGRWARMGWSFETFLQYPLFGGFTVSDAKIGSHSEIFDILGRFGLLGFISMLLFFIYLLRDIARGMSSERGRKMLTTVFIIYFITSVLDPALYTQQVLPIFLLIPFFDSWSENRGK